MVELVLNSLQIRQFRAFRHLEISRLARVNLITGKNNVGKSCLLEALWFYSQRGLSVIWQLLQARDEISATPSFVRGDIEEQISAIRHLFYGRRDIRESLGSIEIGPIRPKKDVLSVALKWSTMQADEQGKRQLHMLEPDEYETVDSPILVLVTRLGMRKEITRRLDIFEERRGIVRTSDLKTIPCLFVPPNGLEPLQIGRLWDAVALTNLEEDILTSLHIITPVVERVNLVGEQEPRRDQFRIPVVRIKTFENPIPLRSMGEGMNRIFGIALALVNAQNGMLLIDEVESGLHYSVQPDLWRLIFQVAQRLNVQVFATTHSWDCIEAFQQAVQENLTEGLLINLREKKDEPGEVVAILFDEQELSVVTREQIEVR
jgi:hypothetical protein